MYRLNLLERVKVRLQRANLLPFSSSSYWEARYSSGGNSGAGSYGKLAKYKADFINIFAIQHQIASVVEYGCGDGNNLSMYNFNKYVGFDVSRKALSLCQQRFQGECTRQLEFCHVSETHCLEGAFDLALSLDVIYHLIEDDVFEAYMKRLFAASDKYVIIYSYDFDRAWQGGAHERGRQFSQWIKLNAPSWQLVCHEKNPYPYTEDDPENTSNSDFFCYKKTDTIL